MLKKISIRMRLTIMSVLLLTACCIGLTFILNLSANRMANVIEAIPIHPTNNINEFGVPLFLDSSSQFISAIAVTESQTARNLFLYQSIAYVALVVLAGGGLTYLISGTSLKPLNALSEQMKNKTVHNLSEPLPEPIAHDEIKELTHSFNEMTDKLNNAFAMQKRFSQSAAHELRTPLAVLKTKVDVFKKKKEHTPQEYDQLLSVISTHTNRLSDLVKDLLNLTNMETLSYDEPIELKTMLENIIEELTNIASEKKIQLSIIGDTPSIQGNTSLLSRSFYNLIENAIKYNHENGSVDITLSASDKETLITITDTGIGIPTEQQKLIFEPFYTVDPSRSRNMGGAGLGLSIAKAILDQHHGQISVCPNPQGGSIFKVTLTS